MSVQSHRLPAGGLVSREPVAFTFDGRPYTGLSGDTLASALVANGVRLVGRSFKYHRPRGILSAGPEEPNALVEIGTGARREPNTRATTAELYDGLVATSQNRWPSLRFDAMAVNSLVSPFLAAGFYYKTFMWPASFWETIYEPLIRRAAGLGRASGLPDPDHYDKVNAFCDVLVVGGGPSGLMAGLAAARAGARVILADEDFKLGGRLLAERQEVAGDAASTYAATIAAELASMPDVTILRRTSVFGVYDQGTYAAVERVGDHLATPAAFQPRQRLWRIVAKRVVLASGAIERPLVFGDNDRPGVMLAGAVRTYLNRFAAMAGRRAVVFTTNDDGLRTARDLAQAGVEVQAIVDPRAGTGAGDGPRRIEGVVSRALGRLGVEGVSVRTARGEETIPCDLVAVAGGWQPAVHLTSHQGGRPVFDDALGAFVPGTMPPGMSVAGAASGVLALADCLASGARAGTEAANDCGFQARTPDVPACEPDRTAGVALWRVKGAKGKAFLDFQNDVTAGDVIVAEREGFRAVEHLKRYTTLGMATDQGKTANVNGIAMMAELTQRTIAETGTTRFRPPYTPVAIGVLAGHHRGKDFKPTRTTPAHAFARDAGAVFMEAGLWLRAAYFAHHAGEDWRTACDREVLATRNAAGLCDVSTLGKIDLQGPDVGTFLDRLYCNTFSTLPVGRARYGLMLREDGFVFDDGTTSRLGPDHWLMTTTTGKAAAVMSHMEFCAQVLWPELDVQFVSVSEQWAQFSLAGPRARDVLAAVMAPGVDVSDVAFPFMAAGAVELADGTAGRLFRISFSGELAYEIAVPADRGLALAQALMRAGAPHGLQPYGLEALNVLRIEKGHATGGELNGQTTAADLGMGRMMSSKKDYIGRAMAMRPALVAPDRPVLVGLRPVTAGEAVSAGAHLLAEGVEPSLEADLGHVTSACHSPSLGHPIALGLLREGERRMGTRLRAFDAMRGRDTLVEVCSPVFVDAQGARLRG